MMGAVDYSDQLHGYYSCRTKSRKFYKYNIYHFLLDGIDYELIHPVQELSSQPKVQDNQSLYRTSHLRLRVTVRPRTGISHSE